MRWQHGFSKLEFAVVLAVFGVLAHFLLDRLGALEHDTERLAVELTVRHIHVGLKLAIGEKIMHGEEASIAGLLERNPLDFLEQKVGAGGTAQAGTAANSGTAQAGTAANMGTAQAETSRWRYDAATHTLRYHPRQPEAFAGREELAWRFVGHRDDIGRMAGLQLTPLK